MNPKVEKPSKIVGSALLSLVVSTGLLAASASVVSADAVLGLLPDGNAHSWCNDSSPNTPPLDVRNHASAAMSDADSRSGLTRSFFSTCISGGAAADVTVRAVDLPAGIRGMWTCISTVSGKCDRSTVDIDRPEIVANQAAAGTGTVDNNVRKSVCHELGHSMGLDHFPAGSEPDGQNSCMVSGHVANANSNALSNHHVGHLNNIF
jgi:hypothetical protein